MQQAIHLEIAYAFVVDPSNDQLSMAWHFNKARPIKDRECNDRLRALNLVVAKLGIWCMTRQFALECIHTAIEYASIRLLY